jgi:hypothetical protein
MDFAKINDWLQVIGVFGVMASLVFVGLQMKQSHEIALAAAYHARAVSAQDLYLAQMQSGFDFTTPSKPISEMSLSELNMNIARMLWSWKTLENNHFQYEAGFLSEEAWQGLQTIIPSVRLSEVGSRVFERGKGAYRASFVELVEQLTEEAGG